LYRVECWCGAHGPNGEVLGVQFRTKQKCVKAHNAAVKSAVKKWNKRFV
jgi:hypothetical protein